MAMISLPPRSVNRYRVDNGDGTYTAESGDTLWGLAEETTGNGSNWTDLGYTGTPENLQIGETIGTSSGGTSSGDSSSGDTTSGGTSSGGTSSGSTTSGDTSSGGTTSGNTSPGGTSGSSSGGGSSGGGESYTPPPLPPEGGDLQVPIVTIDGKQYYDFSDPINNMIWNNAQEAKQHRPGGLDYLSETYDALQWFNGQVTHNGPWDLKIQTRWEEQLPSIRDFNVKKPESKEFNHFVLYGEVITAEDLGNITYRYWGRAAGFGSTLLYAGGGYAKRGNADDPRIYDPKQFYGDDENDHIAIEKGINWYNSIFPDDSPAFDPGLSLTHTIFKGYDLKKKYGL